MCMICVEFQKLKLTPKEALRNAYEMRDELGDHYSEAIQEIVSNAPMEDLLNLLNDENHWDMINSGSEA